jgi:talin
VLTHGRPLATECTQEIIKTWPLTTLRRWAATPTTFTLDFGDYADAYYSVQTAEGDAISQLIGGYIDIILKRKKEAERMVTDGDSELSISEENIVPGRASAAGMVQGRGGQATQASLGQAGVVGRAQMGQASVVGSSAQRATVTGSPSQQVRAAPCT